jgi:nucleotide-binding universal stress UspA family protein
MSTPYLESSAALAFDAEIVMAAHGRVLKNAVQRVLDARPTQSVQSELVRDTPSAALLRFASRSSLLLIGTHRRGVLAGGLLGSVAQEILWRADCPVCVVPPRQMSAPLSAHSSGPE